MLEVRTAEAEAGAGARGGAGTHADLAEESDQAASRQWAVKTVGGGLMIAAAALVTLVTVLYDVRGEAFAPLTRNVNYALSGAVALAGGYLLRTDRLLPDWLANSIPSAAAIVICLPTSMDESPDELGPLLLTWPVTFSAAVLSARAAWATVGVAAVAFAVLASVSRGVDGVVLWIETTASLVVVCWMAVRVQKQSLRLRRELARSARTDPLTGLTNRRGFDEALGREDARRDGPAAGLLLVDIDHFKQVNDTWGHQAGDETLRLLGGLLDASFREADVVGRIGGEEFAVLMVDCGPDEAAERGRALCETVRCRARGWPHPITVSVGVATTDVPGPAPGPAELMAAADAALYAAKEAGRDRVWVEHARAGAQPGLAADAPPPAEAEAA